jgi:hypothetical protein
MQKILVRDKRSDLFCQSINDVEKKFYDIDLTGGRLQSGTSSGNKTERKKQKKEERKKERKKGRKDKKEKK